MADKGSWSHGKVRVSGVQGASRKIGQVPEVSWGPVGVVWSQGVTRPENMTRGSNRLQFVSKATFHSSPSFILTLLYSHQTSSLVKYFTLALDTMLSMLVIRGRQ